MPGPALEDNLLIEQPLRPDHATLLAALADAAAARSSTEAQAKAIAEIRECRAQLARPLDPALEQPPTPADRSRIANLASVTLSVVPDRLAPASAPSVVRLGPDLVSVAIALSDELHLNELAAGVLLYDARDHAAHRADHDVVASAKNLFYARRRESLMYLLEVLRAGLLATPSAADQDVDAFIPRLMLERDALVAEHGIFTNITTRLTEGIKTANAHTGPQRNPRALQKGEAVLLAETLFLLAYTVQLSSDEALALRKLLDIVDEVFRRAEEAELRATKAGRQAIPFSEPQSSERDGKNVESQLLEVMSPQLVEVESVRNLVLLAWMCALDRSRDHDIYDPRSGQNGVNVLLKNLDFIPRTTAVPPLVENQDANICNVSKAQAAAELVGALFRLAVASPDEEEAKLTALRFCAYGGALSFLGHDLTSWIGKRAGSLCADTDLYADVVEDLALDIAEASQFVNAFISFTQQEVSAASAEVAYAAFEGSNSGVPSHGRGAAASPLQPTSSSDPRRYSYGSRENGSGPSKRNSVPGLPPRGKPPRQPSGRNSSRPLSLLGSTPIARPSVSFSESPNERSEQKDNGALQDAASKKRSTTNLISALAIFLAEAISLAPSKLSTDSMGGGLRYWSGIGAPSAGVIHQIGDAVIDLGDATMGNLYAPGGLGEVYRESLAALLTLLARVSQKDGCPSHAAASLQYLRDSGQTAVTLDRASQAISHYQNMFSTSTSRRGAPEFNESDVNVLRGVLDVVANAAESLGPHGGISLVLGEAITELGMRISSLAVYDVPSTLKESLIGCMSGLGNRRAISGFLESMANDKAAPLRHFLRSVEAQSGTFDVTIKVLSLAAGCISWGDDEFPDAAVEAVTVWFAIEEVLAFWSRRKYDMESHRWHVLGAAASLIHEVVRRNPRSESAMRILGRLLTPAPGTGAASYALRALVCSAGLMRSSDEHGQRFSDGPVGANHYGVAGRDSLIQAAERGLGDAYRQMQTAAKVAARLVAVLLSTPSGRIAVHGVVVAPASDLLLGEAKGLSCAASLVFTVDNFTPVILRAGYEPAVCASILNMLACAANESPSIAAILTRDLLGSAGSAAQFRASLANIVARSTTENMASAGNSRGKQSEDPPIMLSALRLVEASLGDGGNAPGIFMLGLQLDSSGLYASADYGVLSALVELVAGAHDSTGRVDDKCRSTAATFLESLAATTVRKTSLAVLEHLKEIAEPSDPNIRGGGFADEMLFRILEAVGSRELHSFSGDVDWAALGELLTACMSLSALQVRLFPRYEIETCTSVRGSRRIGIPRGNAIQSSAIPSPLDLLKVLSLTASSGAILIAASGLRTWCHLLGARLAVHERNTGYSSVPLLFELTSVLLGALAGADSGNELSTLVRRDGGKMAASIVLLCITRMRDCDNPFEPGSEEYIGDAQCTALLTGVVRAISGVVGVGADEAFARTSLYAALLVCGSLARNRVSDDAIGRAFGGRLGPRQVSGAEAVLSAACADAISGPRAGARTAAIAAISFTTVLDPVRSMPALGSQNRLRRVVQKALADPETRRLISSACSNSRGTSDENSLEASRERAAVAVAEAAISLIHAVSSVGHGARVIADSGCVESAGSLLPVLMSSRLFDYGSGNEGLIGDAHSTRNPRTPSRARRDRDADVNEDEMADDPTYGNGSRMVGIDTHKDADDEENRVSMIASVTGAIAAAICCANGAVVDSTLTALDDGKTVLSDLLRGLRAPRGHLLEAVSSMGMIISRIPYELLTSAASPMHLRISLASVLGAVIPPVSSSYQIGGSGSLLSAGINLRTPANRKEARRMSITHPEGGTLFERDLVVARAACAQNVLAALRCPAGVLFLFLSQLGERQRGDGSLADAGSASRHQQHAAMGRLSEVVRVSKAALKEMQRSAEESMQIDTRIAGETGISISSRRVSELSAYCQEEFRSKSDTLNGQIVIDCLKKSSTAARNLADVCISIFESALFILREFVRTARETVRGYPPVRRGPSIFSEDGAESQDDQGAAMSVADAEMLLSDAKNMLVPICKEVEGLAGGIWGSKDSSFCKQLCRQIRTACTGRG